MQWVVRRFKVFRGGSDVINRLVAHESSSTSNIPISNTDARSAFIKQDIFSVQNVAFGNMTGFEMLRSMMVLWICSIPGFSDNAARVLEIGKSWLGRRMFDRLMRATAYGQFVAGDQIQVIHSSAQRLAQNNVAQMLAVPIEAPNDTNPSMRNEHFDTNLSKLVDCVDISRATHLEGRDCLMQLKVTAVMDFENLAYMSTKIGQGELCNFENFQSWVTTGCHANDLVSIAPSLEIDQAEMFAEGVKKLLKVITHAKLQGVGVLIDAEHTWINPVIQHLGIIFMRVFNKRSPVVYLTYQAYLKETRELIQLHEEECRKSDVHFALKLVRGAYVLAETQHHGLHPPYMCDNWEATNENYDSCLTDLLSMDSERTRIVVATHNENSIRLAVKLLGMRGSQPTECRNASFAQLYGMADYMSFTLGRMGYQVHKSVPYGTVDETLLYLSRREKENCLVFGGVRKEMAMLKKGLGRRLSSVV